MALDRSGNAQLEPFTATEVAIKVLATKGEMVQVGVSEVRLPGVDLLPIKLPEVESEIGCGFGPTMRIGSQFHATSITASPRQLFDSDVVPGRVCGPASLDIEPGETRVVVAPAPAFLPVRFVMSQPEATPATAVPGRAQLIDESVTSRTVTFERTQGESLLNLRQNINHGWHADTTDGRSAAAQVVDGWQQGWWVPSGLDSLELNFTVDRVYRLALILGGVGLRVGRSSCCVLGSNPNRSRVDGGRFGHSVGGSLIALLVAPTGIGRGLGWGTCHATSAGLRDARCVVRG